MAREEEEEEVVVVIEEELVVVMEEEVVEEVMVGGWVDGWGGLGHRRVQVKDLYSEEEKKKNSNCSKTFSPYF